MVATLVYGGGLESGWVVPLLFYRLTRLVLRVLEISTPACHIGRESLLLSTR